MKWVSEEAEKEEKEAVEKEEGDEYFGQSKMQMQEFIGPSSFVKHENLS